MKITKKQLRQLVEHALKEEWQGEHDVVYDKDDLFKKYGAELSKSMKPADKGTRQHAVLLNLLKHSIEEAYEIGREDGYDEGFEYSKQRPEAE